MNNEIEIFKNEELGNVRILNINGDPWFIASDVAKSLGYKNTSDAIKRHVDDEDKGVVKHDTLGGNQEMVAINESGMYCLVLGSKKESAKKFKHWVTKEVLPSIRKRGLYIKDELLQNQQLLEDTISELQYDNSKLIEEKTEIEKLNREYFSQENILRKISIKTNVEESYLPSLTVQVLRTFLKTNNDLILNTQDKFYVTNKNPILKEMKRLIINRNDRLYVLISIGVRIEDNFAYIPIKFLDEDYYLLDHYLYL
ncbi:BRO family protein [Clostridium butyricum]|jgi:prophage antirepressor-like protein|uniref:BRO-N domain-containing protein n=1 Tax=Clostridium butyricum TaxID=1492 RepID=UPI003D34C166